MDRYFYSPFHGMYLGIYLLMLIFFMIFFSHSIVVAFAKVGLPPLVAISLFWISLLGSMVNIPVKKVVSRRPVVMARYVSFMGFRYYVPAIEEYTTTVIAVNLGGAIVPSAVSAYLLIRVLLAKNLGLVAGMLIALAIVTAISHAVARPVPGLGIAMPAFIPPIVAALTALLLSLHYAPIIAYFSGTMGVLIGADLMNLDKIPELGASVASIGGAGTFDGIFLSGLIATLLV